MTTSAAQPDTAATPPDADPWRYGWRYVHRPLPLDIEITSPETRRNDLFDKVEHYAHVGVAQYVIVDDLGRGGERRLRLLGYRLALDVYQPQALDDHGRLWLDVAGLWLGVQDDHVVCYDAHGVAVGDYTAVVRAAEEAQQRADIETRAHAAEERADAEARARAEERLRALEAELRRLRATE